MAFNRWKKNRFLNNRWEKNRFLNNRWKVFDSEYPGEDKMIEIGYKLWKINLKNDGNRKISLFFCDSNLSMKKVWIKNERWQIVCKFFSLGKT